MRFVGDFIGADANLIGFNSLGHRCKELSELNLENYILYTGCSHTFGEGLEVEETYPYISARMLNADYYNLGQSGSGIDIVLYNLTQWFYVVKKKPKLLVVQLPDYTRFSSIIDETDNIIPRGNWDKSAEKFIVDAIDNGMLTARKRMALRQINTFGVPTIMFTYGGTIPYGVDGLRMRHLDNARDGCHPGILSHKTFAAVIAELATDK